MTEKMHYVHVIAAVVRVL